MSNGSGLSTTEVLRPVSAAERAEGDPDRGRRAGTTGGDRGPYRGVSAFLTD